MKQIIFISLGTLVVIGLVSFTAYEYQNNRKPAPIESVSQALQERDNAVRHAALVVAVDKVNYDKQTAQISATQSKVTALCTQLHTLKLNNPVCQ